MDNLKAVINKAASAFLYRAAWGVAKEASKQAPKVTGNLAQNIKAQMHGAFNATVGNTAEIYYAKYVYFGARPHVIRPKKKKALANVKKGLFFGKKVNHPGTKPNKYFDRAAAAYFEGRAGDFAKAKEALARQIGAKAAKDIKILFKDCK